MKITNISLQTKNPNRVNLAIDGKFAFGLEIWQVTELKLKIGQEIDLELRQQLEQASQFGKLYAKAVNKTFIRPRSVRQIEAYLQQQLYKLQLKQPEMIKQIIQRMQANHYLDDQRFAEWWVENRNLKKGVSQKKLRLELIKAGISSVIIDQTLQASDRTDQAELKKVLAKKAKRYDDQQKLIRYLMSQGFAYDDILAELKD